MMLYDQTVPIFTQQTQALLGQLDKAAAWCAEQGVSEADLLDARLAPDMLPLGVQLKMIVNQLLQPFRRLTGEALPDPAEAEPTLAAHRDRIAAALALIAPLSPAAVDGDPARMIALDLPNGMAFDLNAADYVRDWAAPQFYFHVVTAYAIMRMRGVPLGKADYVPYMMRHARKAAS